MDEPKLDQQEDQMKVEELIKKLQQEPDSIVDIDTSIEHLLAIAWFGGTDYIRRFTAYKSAGEALLARITKIDGETRSVLEAALENAQIPEIQYTVRKIEGWAVPVVVAIIKRAEAAVNDFVPELAVVMTRDMKNDLATTAYNQLDPILQEIVEHAEAEGILPRRLPEFQLRLPW